MDVTPKAYKIWKRLFEDPNLWMSVPSVAYDVDMTSRQVLSVLKTMHSDYIERRPGTSDSDPMLRLTVTDEEFRALRREVIMSYNNLDEEMLQGIRNALSPVGWTSASDLAIITGYRPAKICVALSIMSDVAQKTECATKLYSLS